MSLLDKGSTEEIVRSVDRDSVQGEISFYVTDRYFFGPTVTSAEVDLETDKGANIYKKIDVGRSASRGRISGEVPVNEVKLAPEEVARKVDFGLPPYADVSAQLNVHSSEKVSADLDIETADGATQYRNGHYRSWEEDGQAFGYVSADFWDTKGNYNGFGDYPVSILI